MLWIPPIGDWWKYAHLWINRIQWKESICRSVWEGCKETQIKAKDILEAKMRLLSQHTSTSHSSDYKDEILELNKERKQLSIREATQLIWHSFRFSNGNAALQFTMLHQAFTKYWEQTISIEEVFDELKKVLQVWKKHTETTEYKNTNWRPPHPKVHKFTRETHTDIWLSTTHSHGKITSNYIQKTDAVIQMLLTWKWHIKRHWTDGRFYIWASREYEKKRKIIQTILEADFEYLCTTDYFGNFKGRPWRNPENDGKNNLKDRFFSYFVWFCLRENTTRNSFFDEYFREIQDFFPKWFAALPSDDALESWNRKQELLEEKGEILCHSTVHPMRKKSNSDSIQITKEDVLFVIAQYNATHPDTQVSMEEIWLSEKPDFSTVLKQCS